MGGISAYQVEMVRKNIVKGLVRMYISGGEVKYELAGLKPMGKTGLLRIISIIDIIRRAREFFFYENGFLLDADKLYLDKNRKIRLIYMPVKNYSGKHIKLDAHIRRSVRTGWLRDNLSAYAASECGSYLKFNSKRLAYAAAILVLMTLTVIFMLPALFVIPVLALAVFLVKKRRSRLHVAPVQTDDRTVILTERNKLILCFSDVFGTENTVELSGHEAKYIGRDEKECALCIKNGAVGRKHARLVFDNGKPLLYDNDSLNSTYLNGCKLKRNKPYELKDGDRIVFADEEYMILITEGS